MSETNVTLSPVRGYYLCMPIAAGSFEEGKIEVPPHLRGEPKSTVKVAKIIRVWDSDGDEKHDPSYCKGDIVIHFAEEARSTFQPSLRDNKVFWFIPEVMIIGKIHVPGE